MTDLVGRSAVRVDGEHRFANGGGFGEGDALVHDAGELAVLLERAGRFARDREGAQALDAAIGEALSRGAASAEAVAHVLDQQRRARNAPPLVDVILPDDPRVRDVRVTPHSLASYDDALRGARGRTSDE